MVKISRKRYPEKHDLVIGIVKKIQKHGVYIKLKEFDNLVGYCHVSEVAGAWIRNIRNFVRIDQTVVAKVLRVKENTNQIDLSLKRVSDQLKKDKIQEYKHQNSAIAMVKLIAEKIGQSEEEIRNLIEDQFIDAYGSMYNGFEEIAAIGLDAINDMGIPHDLANLMLEVADTSIQFSSVIISSTIGIRSFASDGVVHIRSLLECAEEESKKYPDISTEITSIGAPAYRIHLEGISYPDVNDAYTAIIKEIEKKSKTLDVEYKIERDN